MDYCPKSSRSKRITEGESVRTRESFSFYLVLALSMEIYIGQKKPISHLYNSILLYMNLISIFYVPDVDSAFRKTESEKTE